MNSRERILARIGQALGRPGDPAPAGIEGHLQSHPRGPRPVLEGDAIARFRERAARMASDVAQANAMTDVPGVIARYLEQQRLPLRAVCWPALTRLDWRAAGIQTEARAARADDLVGITGVFAAIAETGTLMLLSAPDTPATVSLLPETHVAVVEVSRVVATMEDAWDRLRAERGAPPRAVNFVSGPSRTADIEQTVTLGAHGPYRVLIVLVGGVE